MSLQWDRDYAHRKPPCENVALHFTSVLYFYTGCAVIFGAACGVAWICKWLAR